MYEGDPYGEEIDGEGGANEDDKNDGLNALVRKSTFDFKPLFRTFNG